MPAERQWTLHFPVSFVTQNVIYYTYKFDTRANFSFNISKKPHASKGRKRIHFSQMQNKVCFDKMAANS